MKSHKMNTVACWGVLGRAGLVTAALSACVKPEPLALEREVYEVENGIEKLVDSGCTELPEPGGPTFGFGFGAAPGGAPVPYFVSYAFETDSVLVSAGAFDGNAVEREYDELFLSSGEEDELFVNLAEDFGLLLVNRSVSGCGLDG